MGSRKLRDRMLPNASEPGRGSPLRVMLVDCYANDRVFVRDDSFRALAAEVRTQGFDAELLELTRDEAQNGKSIADVISALRAASPDLVLVSRAWSRALVESLRQAAGPKARLVRYSHGAPSPVDECFDAVLDSAGVHALLAGEEDISAPAWRRTRSEMAIPRALPTPTSGSHPTITGPARGCPFLVDVRTSSAYQATSIDFERVQTKGCAFCLDNVGAYAAFPENVVVDAWLTQLRALRQQQPEVREVLLTDERPHPYLPAFFHAILAEPALHNVEIMIKSRVDWLEEFADNALREACELAAQSSSVLHLYLVGFESFHQPDLDLFNKAVTVADNVRAIETLRRLEARHPGSFEFRKHRAHGFLLFHPWTSPEGLLENAGIIRSTAFGELRSQVLHTRLRLYASVPLHALAQEQGLLVDSFDAGRDDRAVEQGYDASIPWRFADARVEAIFRAAKRIGTVMPELNEADVLEMTTSFVLRWPAFAQSPDLAALPLLYAPLSWGPSPVDVIAVAGAVIAGYDREVEAVAGGEKPACLKEGIRREDVEDLIRAYHLMGVAAQPVSTHALGSDDGRHGRGKSHAIVAVARDVETLNRVVEHQRKVEHRERAHIAAMGELMGYPPCCIEAFAGQSAHGENLELERAPLRAHAQTPLEPLINRFGAVSLISHLLCSPRCEASIDRARHTLDALARVDSAAVDSIVRHLSTPVLRLDYRRAAMLAGRWQEQRFLVQEIRPLASTDFEIDTKLIRAIRLGRDRVIFELEGGGSHAVGANAPMLVEPGHALAAAVCAAIQMPSPQPPAAAPMASSIPKNEAAPTIATQPLDSLAVGTRVGSHTIDKIESDGAHGYCVTLSDRSSSLRIRVRPWDSSLVAVSRRGPWALDLESGDEPTTEQRTIIGALARLLPAGDHHQGTPSAPPTSRPATVKAPAAHADKSPVICTAPWTTLEVVDPDGRVRQCCADWTVGERGNLHENRLTEIWNGDGYRMARRVMAGKKLDQLCNAICPRLYDAKFSERELSIVHGAEAFVANQQRLFEDIAERREVVRARPLYVAVCPSTYCNYDCIMCLHGRSPRRDLPESIWDELLEMLPTLRVLTLLGGEPLANPLAMKFLRSWERSQYPDAAVSLVTNGSLLTENVLEYLEGCRFGSVTVSLNAGTPEVYEQVQRGIALADVLENIDALIDLRARQNDQFPIVLSFVVQPANHTTLIPFAELARGRGLPIRLQPLSPRGPDGLDYYDDADAVARVLESLDAFAAWAASAAPDYAREIHGTRTAIAAEAAGRTKQLSSAAHATRGQPRQWLGENATANPWWEDAPKKEPAKPIVALPTIPTGSLRARLFDEMASLLAPAGLSIQLAPTEPWRLSFRLADAKQNELILFMERALAEQEYSRKGGGIGVWHAGDQPYGADCPWIPALDAIANLLSTPIFEALADELPAEPAPAPQPTPTGAGDASDPLRPYARPRVLGPEDVERFFHIEYEYEPDTDVDQPPTTRVGIIYQCNQPCTFCQLAEMNTHIPPARVYAALDKSRARGARRVILTGGEPTLCRHLPEYLSYAREHGYTTIEMQTNATLLDNRELAARLHQAGLTDAQVSLHGPDSDISDRLTAAPGTHRRTLDGITNLLDVGVRVLLNHLIFRDNCHLLMDFVEMVERRWGRHRDRIIIQFHTPLNEFARPEYARKHIARYSDYAPLLLRAIDRAQRWGYRVKDLQDPTGIPALCVLGADSDYLGPILSQRAKPRLHRWETQWMTRVEACTRCDLADACMGIPRGYLQLHGIGEFHPIRLPAAV